MGWLRDRGDQGGRARCDLRRASGSIRRARARARPRAARASTPTTAARPDDLGVVRTRWVVKPSISSPSSLRSSMRTGYTPSTRSRVRPASLLSLSGTATTMSAALIAGEVTDRTRDRRERRAELAVERSLEERAGPEPLVDDDGDLAPRRCLLVEMDRDLEPSVRRDPQVLRSRDAAEPCPPASLWRSPSAPAALPRPSTTTTTAPTTRVNVRGITRARRRSEEGHSAAGAAPPSRSGRGLKPRLR